MARDLRKLARIEATVAAQTKVVPKPEGAAEVTITPLQVLRRELLTPCATKEAFRAWLIRWLNLDFPDVQVDEESTGSVLEELWRIYHAGVTNDPDFPRRSLLYASRGSYKCVERGTRILTRDHGLQKIEDLAVGDIIWSGWSWRPVADWIHDGVKDGVRLTLKDGHQLTVSPVHRVWVWSRNGLPTWKTVSELDLASDLVMVDAPVPYSFELDEAEYRLGYLLGIVAGDGCTRFMDDPKTRKVCVTASDVVVRKAWTEFCVDTCGRAPSAPQAHRPYDYWINSVEVCDKLAEYGCTTAYSFDKRAPHASFASTSLMAGFVSGLLDTDGTVTQKNNIELPITSKGLLEDVLLMLNALGVQAYVRSNSRLYGQQKHMVHHLVVKARDFPALSRARVVISASKAGVQRVRAPNTKDTCDGLPYEFVKPLLSRLPSEGGRWKASKARKPSVSAAYSTVSREKLSELLDWAELHGHLEVDELRQWRFIVAHKWVAPTSVTRCSADFFDLTVDDDHSYWSNGIISHNTLGVCGVLELLAMVHMDRSVVHLAAIEQQAGKAQQYLREFLDRDGLDEFAQGNNKRTVAVVWAKHRTNGTILTLEEWKALARAERHDYEYHVHYTKVIVNTPQSSNCVDPNTQVVLADGTSKPIRALRSGDVVKSFDVQRGEESKSKIEAVHTTFKQSMRLYFDNGATQVLSEDHPVLTLRGWRRARALRRLDVLLAAPEASPTATPEELRTVVVPLACRNPESALVGTLLGDASMTWPAGKNGRYGRGPRLSVSHCNKQREYLERKLLVLEQIGVKAALRNYTSDLARGQNRVVTETSERLVGLFDLFYGSGRKAVTPRLVKKIDAEALAFWFMDDGSGRAEVGLGHDKEITLATCSFAVEEHQLLIDHLRERFGLTAWVSPVSNGRKTYPSLRFDLPSSRKLAALIDEFVSPCVRYKLPRHEGLLDTRCIECDEPIPFTGTDVGCGFARCEKHSHEVSEWRRRELRVLRKKFTRRVVKVEYLGLAELCDATMSSGPHNFFANSAILLHNSDHVAFYVVDEVDLIRYPHAYEEAKLIPEEQRDCNGVRQPPLTVLTSSRKSASGLVQKEIDEAQEKGTAVRHWSILDVAERCPDEKHRPDLPKENAYLLDHELVALLPKEWEELNQADPKKAADYSKKELFWGCLNNCPRRVAAGCQGRLAGVPSKARMLKSIADIIGKFLDVSAEMGVAQLMCWKPGNEGSIYKHFSRKRHCLSLQEMWITVTGEEPPKHVVLTKQALVDLFIARKVKWAVGMDFGFTHMFAVSLWAIDGRRAFLIDAFEVAGLELNQKIELCDKRLGKYKKQGLVVWPDPAYPSDIKTFRMRGYIMKTHTKDVLGGIDRVRDKLNPPLGHEPELFMLRNDPAGDMMATRFEAYKWKTDAQGRSLDEPDDKDDDTMDGVRYIISNEFRGKGKVVSPTKDAPEPIQPALTPKNWMAAKVAELTGGVGSQQVVVGTRVRRGGFFSDFS